MSNISPVRSIMRGFALLGPEAAYVPSEPREHQACRGLARRGVLRACEVNGRAGYELASSTTEIGG
jgi:hypothetical protein